MAAKEIMPGEESRSPKQHREMPPKEIAPGGDVQERGRGEGASNEVGQFTGQGRTPGLQKK